MTFDTYLNLPADAQRFVSFLAFAGTWSRNTLPPKYVGIGNSAGFRDCVSSVVRADIVTGSYFFDLEIVSEEFFRAKAFARKYWPEIVEQCETDYMKTRLMSNAVFHKVEYYLYHKKPSELKKIEIFSGNAARIFKPVLFEPGYEPLMELLSEGSVVKVITDELTQCLENDSADSAHGILSRGDSMKGRISAAQFMHYHDFVLLFRYLAYGEFPGTETFTHKRGETAIKERPYLLVLLGVKAMNTGGYADAMDFFLGALKVLNRGTMLKNVFKISFLNYYLILSYIHVGTDASLTKARQYLNKKDILDHKYAVIGCVLAEAFTNRDRDIDNYSLRRLSGCSLMSRKLGTLLAYYFQKDEKVSDSVASPNAAALRFEMQECIDMTDTEKAALANKFGEYSALTSIKRVCSWELALNDVEAIVAPSAPQSPSAEPAARVIYQLTPSARGYMPSVNLNMQTRLKSGKWSVPKMLTQ